MYLGFCEGMSTLIIPLWMPCQSHEYIASFTIDNTSKKNFAYNKKTSFECLYNKNISFFVFILSTVYCNCFPSQASDGKSHCQII